jgi:cytochrome c peroxidase
MPSAVSTARRSRAAVLIVSALAVGLGTIATGVSRVSAQAAATSAQDLRARASLVTGSLKTVTAPRPQDFAAYVRDQGALLTLGKALFWDEQLGSDGLACASCHFHAGADNRSKNAIDPGLRNETPAFPGGDPNFGNSPLAPLSTPPFAPNYQLTVADFPLHRLTNPADARSTLLSDANDIVGSAGVYNGIYTGKHDKAEADLTGAGAIFQVNGSLVRNVEPRNTPSVVNAIFNHRNFWDSRARSEFNGQDPIGQLDPGAAVVRAGAGAGGAPVLVAIAPRNMSTASQADGPPLSSLEMQFTPRSFPDLGRKMLDPALVPLGLQQVAAWDSVLGKVSRIGAKKGNLGIVPAYADLVKQAFQPAWWDASGFVVDVTGPSPVVRRAAKTDSKTAGVYTVIEYNFPLYFGFAISEYERTLVANDSAFDRFMEGNDLALTPQQQAGLDVFIGKGRCVNCHSGPELTSASISNVQRDGPIERMVMGDGQVASYDTGHYNIGVRPTLEDIGVGGFIGPQNLPLSDARRYQQCVKAAVAGGADVATANRGCGVPPIRARPFEAQLLLDQAAGLLGSPPDAATLLTEARGIVTAAGPDLRGAAVVTADQLTTAFADQRLAADLLAPALAGDVSGRAASLLAAARTLMPDHLNGGDADPFNPVGPPLGPDERIVADGALKVPGLRNVELTAPYFHNGGQATLDQVVQFYDRGGDFADANRDNLDPDIAPIGLSADEQAALVSFLRSLTDERTRSERPPFDHPSLDVPNGAGTGKGTKDIFGHTRLDDVKVLLPATSGGAQPPLGTAHTPYANFLDPLQ